MSNQIKIGFCIAYDWYLLKYSLPLVYPYADKICLSLDKDRTSWSGEKFSMDERAFTALVTSIDNKNKITVLEENFHMSHLTPMQNEVRQRTRIAEVMGVGGWHVQLDCDEYFLDFQQFARELKRTVDSKPVNICCAWVTLYKKVDNGFLYIKPKKREQVEYIQIATNNPVYEYGRRNSQFNIYTKHLLIHQSWARTEAEITQKLANWGHKNDFDREHYLSAWRDVSADNYGQLIDFHPITPTLWPRLIFLKAETIEEFNNKFKWDDFPYTDLQLILKNNILLAKFRRVLSFFITRQ